ncbi:MAG: DUF1847 domain-containing protein [Candidatus Eisenbacteria bacterium]
MKCALCDDKECASGKDCTAVRDSVAEEYKGETLEAARSSAHVEATYYMQKTRVEEVIEYAKLMGHRKIGIAFCIGLAAEAEKLHGIFARHFEVCSVCCKVCAIPKKTFDLKPVSGSDDEVMCNPVGQARILNDEGTDLNLIVGLCMGHDITFSTYSSAPVSTLVVKDRVLAHNPCGAINTRYYLRRLTG